MGLGFFLICHAAPFYVTFLDEESYGNYTAWFSQVDCIRRSQKRIVHPYISVLAAYTVCGLAYNNSAVSLTALTTLHG